MTADITARVRAGESIKSIAADLGLSESAVYMRLRRAGQSVGKLRAQAGTRTTYPIPDWPGYRVCTDGRIQSCWTIGQDPQQTDHWRDLTISDGGAGRYFVQFGGSSGDRRRLSVRKIYRASLPAKLAERLAELIRQDESIRKNRHPKKPDASASKKTSKKKKVASGSKKKVASKRTVEA